MNVSLRCSDCGIDNPAEAHFCGNCGASLSTAVEVSPERGPGSNAIAQAALSTSATPQQSVTGHCHQCGYANPPTAGFCGNCGASVTKEPASPRRGADVISLAPTIPASVAARALTSVRCRQCGHENPPDTLFCANCGFQHSTLYMPDESTQSTAGLRIPEEYAGFWMRLGSALLDLMIVWFGLAVLSVVIYASSFSYSEEETGVFTLLSTVTWLLPFAYFILFTGLRGQTLGKMALGIYVVNAQGQPPGLWRAALRETIGKLLSTLLIGLGFLMVAWDQEKRGLHDLIFGTYVIKT